jgi:hypothetical protein
MEWSPGAGALAVTPAAMEVLRSDPDLTQRGGERVQTGAFARVAALGPEEAASPLARRPYDLRHAAVSTWLSAGVPPTGEPALTCGNAPPSAQRP